MIHDRLEDGISSEIVEVIRRRHETQSLPAGAMTASHYCVHRDRAALLDYIDQVHIEMRDWRQRAITAERIVHDNAVAMKYAARPDDGTRAGTMGTVMSSQTPALPTARLTLLEQKVEELAGMLANVHVGVLHETVMAHEVRLVKLERAVGEADMAGLVRQLNEQNARTLKLSNDVDGFAANLVATRQIVNGVPDREELDRLTGRVTQVESRQQNQAEYIRDAERVTHLEKNEISGASWTDSSGTLRIWRRGEPIPDDMPGRMYHDIARRP